MTRKAVTRSGSLWPGRSTCSNISVPSWNNRISRSVSRPSSGLVGRRA